MLLATPFILASTLIALADLEEAEDGWTGQINAAASLATGNTENTVLGGNFEAARKYGAITHAFEGGGNYAEATQGSGETQTTSVTQNRWFGQYRIEVETGDKSFVYGRVRYGEDQFSGFDRQAFIGTGVGHSFYENEKGRLTVLVGPGFQYLERARPQTMTEEFERAQGTLALFFGEAFRHEPRENVSIEQSLDATISDRNVEVTSVIALKTKLTDHISSRINYQVIHNTDPPDGREQTDTLLSAAIGYEF